MKKPISLIAMIMVIGFSIYFYSCREKQLNPPAEVKTNSVLSSTKTAGNCNCDPSYTNPYCEECVWKFVGGGATSKTQIIHWTDCSSTDPLFSNSCITDGNGAYSSVITFCYGTSAQQGTSTDCNLYMSIDDVPPCIKQCQAIYPYCIKYKVLCNPNGKDFDVTLLDEDPNISATITYTISGDPILTICCSKTVGSNTYSYCCTGSF